MALQAPNLFTRTMANAFNENNIITEETAFQQFFGRPKASFSQTILSPDSLVVDIDIVRGNKKKAKFIKRGATSVGRSIDKQANTKVEEFSSISRDFGLIQEIADVDSSQLLKRIPGENPYKPLTQQQRLFHLMTETQAPKNISRMVSTMEGSAAEAILTGVMTVTGPNDQYDFYRNSANTIDKTGDEWDGGTPTVIADIGALAKIVHRNGKMKPDMCVMGEDAYSLYINDPDVIAKADNRSLASDFIQISMVNPVPEEYGPFVKAGFIARGQIKTDNGYKLWLFTYLAYSETDAGAEVEVMPTDTVLVCASKARADRYFGPNQQLPLTSKDRQWMIEMIGIDPMGQVPMHDGLILGANKAIVRDAFSFYAYQSEDGQRISLVSQIAPIFSPTQTDSFGTLTNVKA